MTMEEFTPIAERYMDTIYRVTYSWTKHSQDANDVTQEVLLQLYKSTKDFESEAHLKNWLIRVTINQCKMLFRAPWRKTENIDDYANTLGFEESDHLALFQAVMQLDKKYRVPLMLFYYEGYSTSEIASLMDIPEKTVSTRLFRARAKLKEELKEE